MQNLGIVNRERENVSIIQQVPEFSSYSGLEL